MFFFIIAEIFLLLGAEIPLKSGGSVDVLPDFVGLFLLLLGMLHLKKFSRHFRFLVPFTAGMLVYSIFYFISGLLGWNLRLFPGTLIGIIRSIGMFIIFFTMACGLQEMDATGSLNTETIMMKAICWILLISKLMFYGAWLLTKEYSAWFWMISFVVSLIYFVMTIIQIIHFPVKEYVERERLEALLERTSVAQRQKKKKDELM